MLNIDSYTEEMSSPRTFGELPPSSYPGERLGLPQEGIGSVTRVVRRLAGLFVDNTIALVLALGFSIFQSSTHSLLTLLWFAILHVVGICTIGGSPGHRVSQSRVVRIDGTPVNLVTALIRTGLLILVVPALVWDSDQRGFHDKVAGTVLIRSS